MAIVVRHRVVLACAALATDSKDAESDEIDGWLLRRSCGTAGAYCALQKSANTQAPAPLEGEFKGKATYYNETQAGTQYSTCGIERAQSLNEGNIQVYAAALNKDQFDPYTVDGIPSNNPICQKKALVKGSRGEIIVRFIDRCPDCKTGQTMNRRRRDEISAV